LAMLRIRSLTLGEYFIELLRYWSIKDESKFANMAVVSLLRC